MDLGFDDAEGVVVAVGEFVDALGNAGTDFVELLFIGVGEVVSLIPVHLVAEAVILWSPLKNTLRRP